MRIGNDSLVLNDTDMAEALVSEPIWLGHIINYSIQIVFTGASPTGDFTLEASLDEGRPNAAAEDNRDFNITNWTLVENSTQAITQAGSHMYEISDCGYRWVRLKWTPDMGGSVGTITSARFNVKGV